MSMHRLSWAYGLALTLIVPGSACAQLQPDSVHHRNECRLARQILLQGQPANKRDWALNHILRCGAVGGATIAAMVSESRHHETNDPGLEQTVMLTASMRDDSIFGAALGVAQDAAAGKASRIQALRILYFQIASWMAMDPYGSFLADSGGTYVPLSDWEMLRGTPLRPDAVREALAVGERLLATERDRDVLAAADKLRNRAQFELNSSR